MIKNSLARGKKRSESMRQKYPSVHSKAMLLPMPRDEVDRTILFTRIGFQRLRDGEATRDLVNQVAEVVLFTTLVTKAGYGRLPLDFLEGLAGC